MKVLLDTSVLVAGLVEAHPGHLKAFPWLRRDVRRSHDVIVASHSLLETFAVLTRLPLRPRIEPQVAWQLVEVGVLPLSRGLALTSREYLAVVASCAGAGLRGGIVYDALVMAAARKAGAQEVVTFNAEHFERLAVEGAPHVHVL